MSEAGEITLRLELVARAALEKDPSFMWAQTSAPHDDNDLGVKRCTLRPSKWAAERAHQNSFGVCDIIIVNCSPFTGRGQPEALPELVTDQRTGLR